MLKCSRCEKIFDSYDSLRRHAGRIHKIDSTTFYVEYHLNGHWPVCQCGCDKKVKWSKVNKKFCEFVQGHQSRIHNNWGHNPSAIQNSADTRRKQFSSGERKVWNDGLDINDEKVKKYGKGISLSFTQHKKCIYSNIMRKNRLSGVIPTLFGKDSPRWNGGTSSISNIVYSNSKLYKEWKYPILIRDGFKCTSCGSVKNLHVHHDRESLAEIIKNHVDENSTGFEEKKMVAEKVIDYHVNNNVSGIILCKKCHNKLHPSLNF